MTCYINALSMQDYAKEAFLYEDGTITNQGGIYAGLKSPYLDPNDPDMFARARLVTVNTGKVFVRWVNSHIDKWEDAANGNWWTSDNCTQRIVTETIKKFGPAGDSGPKAREFSNVGYTWRGEKGDFGPPGAYRSDMKRVVVCKAKFPIQVLTGLGRPVTNMTAMDANRVSDVTLDSKEPQVVILASIGEKKEFGGAEFLEKMWFGGSSEFTSWWVNANPLRGRRPGVLGA